MTYSCREICNIIDELAPPRYALEGDPVGLCLGGDSQSVKRLFVALELTPDSLAEALAFGADMVFVHHTPFYRPFPSLREDDGRCRVALELVRNRVALYAAHTNLDHVPGGVSDVLAAILGITDTGVLRPLGPGLPMAGAGRVGTLPGPVSLGAFAQAVAERLGAGCVRYVGDSGRLLRRVACCGGSGAFLIQDAKDWSADAFVTADIKHHDAAMATELGLALVDPGHFASENPAMRVIAARVAMKAPDLEVMVSEIDADPFVCVR